jgi:hypothetical protein
MLLSRRCAILQLKDEIDRLPLHRANLRFRNVHEDESYMLLRFREEDLPAVVEALHLPGWIAPNRSCFHREEALLLVLRRFAYPCR